MLATQQEGYPCSPHCAGYLRELEQRKVIERLRGLVNLALRGLHNDFEPDNQSAIYNRIKRELDDVPQQQAPTRPDGTPCDPSLTSQAAFRKMNEDR